MFLLVDNTGANDGVRTVTDPHYVVRYLGPDEVNFIRSRLPRLIPIIGGAAPEEELKENLTRDLVAHMASKLNGETPAISRSLREAVTDPSQLAAAMDHWRLSVDRAVDVMEHEGILARAEGFYIRGLYFSRGTVTGETVAAYCRNRYRLNHRRLAEIRRRQKNQEPG